MLRCVLPVFVLASVALADGKVNWKATYADALAEAKTSHKLILVDFFSPT